MRTWGAMAPRPASDNDSVTSPPGPGHVLPTLCGRPSRPIRALVMRSSTAPPTRFYDPRRDLLRRSAIGSRRPRGGRGGGPRRHRRGEGRTGHAGGRRRGDPSGGPVRRGDPRALSGVIISVDTCAAGGGRAPCVRRGCRPHQRHVGGARTRSGGGRRGTGRRHRLLAHRGRGPAYAAASRAVRDVVADVVDEVVRAAEHATALGVKIRLDPRRPDSRFREEHLPRARIVAPRGDLVTPDGLS